MQEIQNEMQNLEKIRKTRQERIEQGNTKYKLAYLKAIKTKTSAVQIKGFCYECVGTHSEDVLDCCGYGCPLYFHRPFRHEDTEKVRQIIEQEEFEKHKNLLDQEDPFADKRQK